MIRQDRAGGCCRSGGRCGVGGFVLCRGSGGRRGSRRHAGHADENENANVNKKGKQRKTKEEMGRHPKKNERRRGDDAPTRTASSSKINTSIHTDFYTRSYTYKYASPLISSPPPDAARTTFSSLYNTHSPSSSLSPAIPACGCRIVAT